MNELMNVQVPLWLLALYGVFMCFVQSIPRPEATDSRIYITVYRFLHLLCINIQLFFDPTKKLKTEAPSVIISPSTNTPPAVETHKPASEV